MVLKHPGSSPFGKEGPGYSRRFLQVVLAIYAAENAFFFVIYQVDVFGQKDF